MKLITEDNLSTYVNDLSDKLGWTVIYHSRLYQDVARQENTRKALIILDNRIRHWFIRGGWMSPDWQLVATKAINTLKKLDYDLPDMVESSKLSDVIEILEPLGQIKRVKSGNENFMPASKILNFIFPELIPKIDTYWIKDVCLRKANNALLRKRFVTSGPIDLDQYKDYLRFGSEQKYDPSVLEYLESIIGVKNAYAVVFEYCLLGYSKEEILRKLTGEITKEKPATAIASPTEGLQFTKSHGIKYHRNYLRSERLKAVFDSMREDIRLIGVGIEEHPVKSYIGYKIYGKLMGWILVYRNSIEIGTYSIDEKMYIREEKFRVRSTKDDYSKIIDSMKKYYFYLGAGRK